MYIYIYIHREASTLALRLRGSGVLHKANTPVRTQTRPFLTYTRPVLSVPCALLRLRHRRVLPRQRHARAHRLRRPVQAGRRLPPGEIYLYMFV